MTPNRDNPTLNPSSLSIADAAQLLAKVSGEKMTSQMIEAVARTLIDSLTTAAAPRDREIEAEKARAISRRRFAK